MTVHVEIDTIEDGTEDYLYGVFLETDDSFNQIGAGRYGKHEKAEMLSTINSIIERTI
jgi:hypothetical protein